MGILTGLIEVEANLFKTCKKKKKLPLLVDVVVGWEEPTLLGLAKDHEFNRISQDKGWDEISTLMYARNEFSYRAHEKYRTEINHDSIAVGYYTPARMMYALGVYYRVVRGMATKEEKELIEQNIRYVKYGRGVAADYLLLPEFLPRTFKILERYFLENHSDVDLDGYDIPYVLSHYTDWISIMTQALFEVKNDKVIMKKNYVIWNQS